jgi:hypothetical protein
MRSVSAASARGQIAAFRPALKIADVATPSAERPYLSDQPG